MKLNRLSAPLLLTVIGLVASVASAQQTVTITATPAPLQSNFGLPNPQGTGAGESAPIGATAFDFRTQPQLSDIASISLTMTIVDGDTGPGTDGIYGTSDDDFDVNSWTLRLDGVETGILLNGFSGIVDPNAGVQPGDYVRLTITDTPANVPALLAALQDGFLSATIFDSTGVSKSNSFRVPSRDSMGNDILTTLSITGTQIPEPATSWLLLSTTLAMALFLGRGVTRRFPSQRSS
ncbi:MAG: hypothetical protein ACR2HH_08310 [Chthoniobacterales bacterium]